MIEKTKLATVVHLLKENRSIWLFLYTGERLFKATTFFRRQRIRWEIFRKLPGFNTTQYNHKEWSNYDWSHQGEEWTDSATWRQALIEDVLKRHLQPNSTVLEIGPGAGRWSETLATLSKKLILVDLTESSIAHCRNRLKTHEHVAYHQNNGRDLSFVFRDSVDFVWSFDVFVHVSPADTAQYLEEIQKILSPGGIAIIHHPAMGGARGGFRSSVTNDLFCQLLKNHNLKLIRQFDSFGKDDAFSVKTHGDMITIFGKMA